MELEIEKFKKLIEAKNLEIKEISKKYKDVETELARKDLHNKEINALFKTLEQLGTKKRDIMRELEKDKAEEITSLRKKMTNKIEELKSN